MCSFGYIPVNKCLVIIIEGRYKDVKHSLSIPRRILLSFYFTILFDSKSQVQ